MFKSGMMNLQITTPVANRIMFCLVLVLCMIAAFYLGRIYQLESIFAPRPSDNLIDGTCREILKHETEKETGYETS